MPAIRKLSVAEIKLIESQKHVNQHTMSTAEYKQCRMINTARFMAEMDGTHQKGNR